MTEPPGPGPDLDVQELSDLNKVLEQMGPEAAEGMAGLGLEPPKEEFVRGDQAAPGYHESGEQVDLSPTELVDLAEDLMGILDMYDEAMTGRVDREREIEVYYALADDPIHGGTTSDAEHLVSELMMTQVDQATARIVENITATKPLIKADPVVRRADEEQMRTAKEFAAATERFLNNYGKDEMQLDRKLPIAIHRACKVGTAVLHQKWVERTINEEFWTQTGEHTQNSHKVGGIEVEMPHNEDVVVYPINKANWQECTIVGHRSYLTTAEWRAYAMGTLNLTAEETLAMEIDQPQEQDDRTSRSRPWAAEAYFGVKRSEELQESIGQIGVTNLYVRLPVAGRFQIEPLNIILNERHRKILFISKNRHFRNTIPYHPIRYKVVDNYCWGIGVGDEIVYAQAADSALRNLQMDNIMSGAFHLVQVRAGTMADILLDRPLPGQVVPVDNPGEDIVVQQMGGTATGIDEAIDRNRFFAREATGLSPVMSGQGDPTMKSGAGTGSTMALIEQAGKKFGQVDRNMRTDLSDAFEFTLELVTQYATDGLFYRYVSDEDAGLVEMVKYLPARGMLRENLRIWAMAPNAASSHEGRRSSMLVAWQFLNQHYTLMLQMGEEIMGATNPMGWERYKERSLRFLDVLGRQITEYQDVPGLTAEMPEFPEMTSADQQLNELLGQNQELQQQLQSMQQQQQMAMQQPGAPPGAPTGPQPAPAMPQAVPGGGFG